MHRPDQSPSPSTEESLGDTTVPVVADSESEIAPEPIPTEASLADDLINVVRGYCMGAADTVPGISGGTIALILGHYERLVTAISHVDAPLLRMIGKRRFQAASRHVDFRFLAALGLGIAAGVISLAGLMHWLLDHHMPETFAVFFGLLAASVWIVHRSIDQWNGQCVTTLLIGIVIAVVISNLPVAGGSVALPYLFFAGAVAICAMILPGISGAFVLLLLGVYHEITGLIKDTAKGEISSDSVIQMLVFAAGCGFGLLAFSRLLRWLLQHYHGATMAGLMGLMVGSVAKLWPLQIPTVGTADMELKYRVLQYVSPSEWNGSLTTLISLMLVSAVVVLVIERYADNR